MGGKAPVPDVATASVPTIAAQGGGGAGGNGSGKKGKKGKSKKKKKGKKGKQDPKTGKKQAKKCKAGKGGSCTKCGHKPVKGDPIDLTTGEMFTLPSDDLESPGFVKLFFVREYSSDLIAQDIGLGFGWSHNFAWKFAFEGKLVSVRKADGHGAEFEAPTRSEPSRFADWTLATNGRDYFLDSGDEFVHTFSKLEPEDPKSGYALTRVEHRSKNGFSLQYARGVLVSIVDSAQRTIVVERGARGRIASLSIACPETGRRIVHARYTYDPEGNLVAFTDADGHTTRFTYDADHRMVAQKYPDGPTFHYAYDREGRCVESWGDYEGANDPALAPGLPKFLEDKRTRVKGIAHVKLTYDESGYIEYSDSRRFQRFFVNDEADVTKAVAGSDVTQFKFDDLGNVLARIDTNGAVTLYDHDDSGRLLRETDPLGRSFFALRDEDGNVARNVDFAGNSAVYGRDRRGNVTSITDQRGNTTHYEFDERGQITRKTDPVGAVSVYRGDAMGNLVAFVEPNGATWGYEYDYFGRMVKRTDPLGRVVTREYAPSGRVVRTAQGDGFAEFTYDGLGNVTRVVRPDGVYVIRYGGFGWPYERVEPSGDTTRVLYNHEGWPLVHFNEAGEACTFEYDEHGMYRRVAQFNGAVESYAQDAMHFDIKETTEETEAVYTRDIVGRKTQIDFSDERSISFDYQVMGHLASADTPEGSCQFEYDATGNVVAEHQEIDGETFTVFATYDALDRLVGLDTSLGHEVEIRRDVSGERRSVLLDGARVDYERNIVGLETALALPKGGRIEREYDERYRLSCVRALTNDKRAPVMVGEPEFVGRRLPSDVVSEQRFAFSAAGAVVAAHDTELGTTSYTYDARRQLVARDSPDGRREAFSYDVNGNVREWGSGTREYGPGNTLLRRGDTHFEHDKDGRLVERYELAADGQRVNATRYTWSAQDLLTRVETPDGLRVDFTYDAFARRSKKTVSRLREEGALSPVREVLFVWFGRRLLHEITRPASGEETIRTYAYTDREFQPFAQHERRATDDVEAGEWMFYVGDVIHTPQKIVQGDGRAVGAIERSAFGKARATDGSQVQTPMRFSGQYEDSETGLHYNLHRYYDPTLGRYISPDPIRLQAGENFFAYCSSNPIGLIDPWGLDHTVDASLEVTNPESDQKGTWVPTGGDKASPQNPSQGQLKSGWKEAGKVAKVPGATSTAGESEGTVKDPPTKDGKRIDTANKEQPYSHTEQHGAEWAEKNFGKKDLKGSKLKFDARPNGLPPCPRCNDRMAKFAKDNDATVDYHYPQNNHLQYKGSKGPTLQNADASKKQKALEQAYQKRNELNASGASLKGKSGEKQYIAAADELDPSRADRRAADNAKRAERKRKKEEAAAADGGGAGKAQTSAQAGRKKRRKQNDPY